MYEGEFDIYGNRKKNNDDALHNGERIATIQLLVSVYERRLKRFQEEAKLITNLTEFQYELINKLGITSTNMTLSPVENRLASNNGHINSSDKYINENSQIQNNKNDEVENIQEEDDSMIQTDKLSYSSLNFNCFLDFFKKETKKSSSKICSMHDIFQNFPIFESAFFDKNFNYNIKPICEYIQTLTQDKRQEFFSEIWISLNNLPYYLNNFFSLIESDSLPILSELVESALSQSLNYSHVLLYFYDPEKSLLVIDKQNVNINHKLQDGLISNAIKNNQPILIDRNDPNIKYDDLSIIVKHEKAFFIPILDISIVLAFFDKIEKFTPHDELIAHSSSLFIKEIARTLQLQKRMSNKNSTFQSVGQIFIELSSMCEIDDFLNTMTTSLIKAFKCSRLCFFEVSQSSRTFCRFESKKSGIKENKKFQIGHGIIGYSISKKSTINLTRPEFSILFENEADRPENGYKVDSILSCPVFDKEGEVKWSIVLFNKLGSDGFTQEDVYCIETFTKFFNSIIETVLSTSKLTDEVKSSSRTIEETEQIVDFVSSISNLDDLTDISSHVTSKLKETAKIRSTEIFTVNQRLNCIFGSSKDDDVNFFIEKVKPDSDDPIIKFSLTCEMKESQSEQNMSKIYCPLIGLNENVIGMMVLSKENDGSQSSIPFKKKTRLQKKLSSLNGKKNETFSMPKDQKTIQILDSWSKIVGELVEVSEQNKKIKQLIQIHERIINSLQTLNSRTVSYLYPQIELNFIVKNENIKTSETNPLVCLDLNDDLVNNYVLLISLLNQFPSKNDLLIQKRSNQGENKKVISEDFFSEEFPLSNSFDVFQYNEKQLSVSLKSLMRDLGIIEYFKFDQIQVQKFIDSIRSLHRDKKFTNWQLSIDRVQFLNYFLNKTDLHKKFDLIQKVVLFLYLITMNCDPILSEGEYSRSKYFLESGPSLNVGSTVFIVLSLIPNSPFFLMKNDEQNKFFGLIESLDQINEVDSSISSDLFVLTALICSFSFLARDLSVSENWVKLRIDEEAEKNNDDDEFCDDVVNFMMEFEMNSLIQPALTEFSKNEIKIDDIRCHFIDCLSKITSASF